MNERVGVRVDDMAFGSMCELANCGTILEAVQQVPHAICIGLRGTSACNRHQCPQPPPVTVVGGKRRRDEEGSASDGDDDDDDDDGIGGGGDGGGDGDSDDD